jgi:hypothetical protein
LKRICFATLFVVVTFAPAAQAADGLAKITPAAAACPDDSGNRFVDCGNGTVTDNTNGLIWLQNAACFGVMPEAAFSTAMATAQGLSDGACGLTDGSQPGDWRLPSKAEWEAMVAGVDVSCDPRIADDAGTGCWMLGESFVNVQSERYWSATTEDGNVNRGFFITLTDGTVDDGNKDGLLLVWPVRTSQ